MAETPDAVWEFYCTEAGRRVVSEEIQDVLGDDPPKRELGSLMWRIQHNRALPRDTRALGQGLFEARLTYVGNEYRLYFARGPRGEHLLLGLAFHMKGSQGAQNRVITLARDRLADWLRRI
ncbi:type II toxin-antitoxin system RelE/ParE family toxin [Actinomadura sp. ATCC 31491]|uniref:Type II toxin-antitoxin system RelE/ParE family toxin n=1 Tax=Actinomadura luzonensis TaxID=2805427 RepID=A0ABT0G0N9_9ACTN|nr:type II toxin-antitoxin system RelE/ParE family toxin [Actinomadura luzonensis]MCK2218122.1 type II toxin-antitoxin system RelE/ParE family toxin [Actinomadura luzonensis]